MATVHTTTIHMAGSLERLYREDGQTLAALCEQELRVALNHKVLLHCYDDWQEYLEADYETLYVTYCGELYRIVQSEEIMEQYEAYQDGDDCGFSVTYPNDINHSYSDALRKAMDNLE